MKQQQTLSDVFDKLNEDVKESVDEQLVNQIHQNMENKSIKQFFLLRNFKLPKIYRLQSILIAIEDLIQRRWDDAGSKYFDLFDRIQKLSCTEEYKAWDALRNQRNYIAHPKKDDYKHIDIEKTIELIDECLKYIK